MQLTVNINDKNIAEKILWFLKSFSTQGVEIKEIVADDTSKSRLSDEYIDENWEQILADGLQNYDENYYKSYQHKLDKGKYLMEKYK